jgi:hypothetical protein
MKMLFVWAVRVEALPLDFVSSQAEKRGDLNPISQLPGKFSSGLLCFR